MRTYISANSIESQPQIRRHCRRCGEVYTGKPGFPGALSGLPWVVELPTKFYDETHILALFLILLTNCYIPGVSGAERRDRMPGNT